MRMNIPLCLVGVAVFVLACNGKEKSRAVLGDVGPSSSSSAKPLPLVRPGEAAGHQDTTLAIGDSVPDVTMLVHAGQRLKLSDYVGRPIVVYFYPKDDSPGCTVEASEFRDNWSDLESMGALVIGVSTDDTVSHRAFASKLNIPFLLAEDPRQELSAAFGVPVNNGKAHRMTFLIDRRGKVAQVWPNVRPRGSAAEVLAALRALPTS